MSYFRGRAALPEGGLSSLVLYKKPEFPLESYRLKPVFQYFKRSERVDAFWFLLQLWKFWILANLFANQYIEAIAKPLDSFLICQRVLFELG